MTKKKLNSDIIYKVFAIGGKVKHRTILQAKIDDIEDYARKHKLTLNIEWEE